MTGVLSCICGCLQRAALRRLSNGELDFLKLDIDMRSKESNRLDRDCDLCLILVGQLRNDLRYGKVRLLLSCFSAPATPGLLPQGIYVDAQSKEDMHPMGLVFMQLLPAGPADASPESQSSAAACWLRAAHACQALEGLHVAAAASCPAAPGPK